MRVVLTVLGITLSSPAAGAVIAAALTLLWLLSRRRRREPRWEVTRAQRQAFEARIAEHERRVLRDGPTIIATHDRFR